MPAPVNTLGSLQGVSGDIQSPLGHIEIDTDPYLIVPGHYLTFPITPFAPKQSEGDPTYQSYSDADSPIAQSTWVGGMGRFRDIDTQSLTSYFEGSNVDPALASRFTISPLQASEATGVATSATRLLEFNGSMIAVCGNQIILRNDGNGLWATQFTFTNPITDVAIFNANLFVGFGDVADAQYSNGADLTTWTTLTNRKATRWATDKNVIYRFFAKNQVDSSVDGITGWGTAILTGVGDSSTDFTNAVSGGVLAFWYCVKTNGVYDLPYVANNGQTQSASATARLVLPFPYRFASNGLGTVWHGTELYIGNGHSVWQFKPSSFTGGDAQDISPFRQADLVGQIKGEVTALFPTPRFLYCVLTDTTNNNLSNVLRRDWTSGKWHIWLQAPAISQALYYRPKEIASAVEAANPTIWFPSGTNVVHVTMPTYGEDPLSDPNCRFNISYSYDAPMGTADPTKMLMVPDNTFASPPIYMILSSRDLNLADENKTENTVRVVADRLNGGTSSVAVDYNEDELRDSNGNLVWTFLGRAETSPVSELAFPTGTQIPVAPPPAPILSATPITGGSWGTVTLTIVLSYITSTGGETLTGLPATIGLVNPQQLTVQSPPAPPGAAGATWRAYATGGPFGTGYAATPSIAIGTNLVAPSSSSFSVAQSPLLTSTAGTFPGLNSVVGRRQMLRLRPFTSSPLTTPVVRAVVAHKRVLVQVRWGWDITVMAVRRQTGRNEAMTWQDALRQARKLQRLHELGIAVTFKDRDGYTFTVLIASITITEVKETNTTQQWAIQLRLIQSRYNLQAGVNNPVDNAVFGAGEAATVDEDTYVGA